MKDTRGGGLGSVMRTTVRTDHIETGLGTGPGPGVLNTLIAIIDAITIATIAVVIITPATAVTVQAGGNINTVNSVGGATDIDVGLHMVLLVR
jgi:hypothetical protein